MIAYFPPPWGSIITPFSSRSHFRNFHQAFGCPPFSTTSLLVCWPLAFPVFIPQSNNLFFQMSQLSVFLFIEVSRTERAPRTLPLTITLFSVRWFLGSTPPEGSFLPFPFCLCQTALFPLTLPRAPRIPVDLMCPRLPLPHSGFLSFSVRRQSADLRFQAVPVPVFPFTPGQAKFQLWRR